MRDAEQLAVDATSVKRPTQQGGVGHATGFGQGMNPVQAEQERKWNPVGKDFHSKRSHGGP